MKATVINMYFEFDDTNSSLTYTELEQEYEKCKEEYITRFGADLQAASRDASARMLLEKMDKIFERMLMLDTSRIITSQTQDSSKLQ
ncbi:MAG: hypothetical protein E7315_02100 [Clostridiales bacterium]|nr:hypothetical protein [Clostridiales bacterium]